MELPEFLREQIERQYSAEETERIYRGFAVQRNTSLRINPLRTGREQVEQALTEKGLAWDTVSWYADARVLPPQSEASVREMEIYQGGGIYLQNLSSMIPPLLLSPGEGENILDMAAAPGGKTTQMAALSQNRAMITACERNAPRAERLRHNLALQGAGRCVVMQQDARQISDMFAFDKVLLDAPCSGSGTYTQGSRGTFSKKNLETTTRLQRELLGKALKLLRPGHEMVYSTCSILRQENEEIVAPFLKRGVVQVLPADAALEEIPRLSCGIPGALCVCPDECYEGFFAVHLRKN